MRSLKYLVTALWLAVSTIIPEINFAIEYFKIDAAESVCSRLDTSSILSLAATCSVLHNSQILSAYVNMVEKCVLDKSFFIYKEKRHILTGRQIDEELMFRFFSSALTQSEKPLIEVHSLRSLLELYHCSEVLLLKHDRQISTHLILGSFDEDFAKKYNVLLSEAMKNLEDLKIKDPSESEFELFTQMFPFAENRANVTFLEDIPNCPSMSSWKGFYYDSKKSELTKKIDNKTKFRTLVTSILVLLVDYFRGYWFGIKLTGYEWADVILRNISDIAVFGTEAFLILLLLYNFRNVILGTFSTVNETLKVRNKFD